MDLAFKQRMVGAVFILSLGVILIPVLFESPHLDKTSIQLQKPKAPDMPNVQSVSRINYVFNDLESNFSKADEVTPETLVHETKTEQMPTADVAANEPENSRLIPEKSDTPEMPIFSPAAEPSLVPIEKASASLKDVSKWTIQLGAFSSRANANVLLKKLTQQGFESYLKDDKQRHLVRVFIAPGVEHEKAITLLSKLDKQLGIKGLIVRFDNE